MGIFGKSRAGISGNRGATIIAEGCRVEGDISGLKTPLYVEGTLEGHVASEAEVVVGPNGCIRGEVRARNLVVNGRVEGRIICEQLDIMPAGVVSGELMSVRMSIEPGGRFVGRSLELGQVEHINILEVSFLEAPEDRPAVVVEQLAGEERGSP